MIQYIFLHSHKLFKIARPDSSRNIIVTAKTRICIQINNYTPGFFFFAIMHTKLINQEVHWPHCSSEKPVQINDYI